MKKPKLPTSFPKPNLAPGSASVTSNVKNVSNTGQMSTSTHTTGSTGASTNNMNVYSSTGAAGAPGVSSSTVVSGSPATNIQVGETPGAWNWMDDAITSAIKTWPRG